MKKELLLFLLFLSITSYGQKENLIKYLDAYKTFEFDESKKIISNLSFSKYKELILLDYNEPTGIYFETDINGMRGYKAIVVCKLQLKNGSSIEKKMIVVMYINKNTNQWSICEFREALDPVWEYNFVKDQGEDCKLYSGKQYFFRSMAYWALNSGKLNEAAQLIQKAKSEAKNDPSFSILELESIVNLIR
jgi:hypothetical protein